MGSDGGGRSASLEETRRSLHGVAELVLAGPQFAVSQSIELRRTVGGFGTVAPPDLRVEGVELVGLGHRLPIGGQTPRTLAGALHIEAVHPGVYHHGSDVTVDETLRLDPQAAAELAAAWAAGDEALRAFAPLERPVLWPEHFDIAITVAEVNYGVSPGDSFLDVPYAYVGPWTPRSGSFWNAPFGAARPVTELEGAAGVEAFFREGMALL